MSADRLNLTGWLLAASLSLAGPALAAPAEVAPAGKPAEAEKPKPQVKVVKDRYEKEGVIVEFEATPLDGSELMEGMFADVRFRIKDAATGQPVRNANPGAWLDLGQVIQGQAGAEQKECKDKIALYLRGVVGIRPMVDLNSYYVLVLNNDASISVVDPLVSMAGRTSTLASIVLRRPPQDWAKSADDKRLYVTMPIAGEIAVVDTEKFRVLYNVEAGRNPVRVAVQPDGKYVWVGNDSKIEKDSGVTVIETRGLKRAAQIATGGGHHELAFSDDSRYALVTNRDAGTATLIDIGTLERVKDIKTGSTPLSAAWSSLAKAFYVADGRDGTVTVISADTLEVSRTIRLAPGLGPMRFTWDGRYVMVVNTSEDKAYVIDASSNEAIHEIATPPQPFQVSFTRAFGYIRSLGSERVTMVNVASLGPGRKPIVQGFQAGSAAPKLAGNLPIADAISPAKLDAAVFVVNPADNTTYFYMEGMNAPMGNYKVFGHQARAVTFIDRALQETEPGVYSTQVRLPVAGRYDVAFTLNTPRLLHCFSAQAKANPMLALEKEGVDVEFLVEKRLVQAAQDMPLRFKLVRTPGDKPMPGLKDVRVRYFKAPASARMVAQAKEIGEGVYEANLVIAQPGAYYVYVDAPSTKLTFREQVFLTLRAVAQLPQGIER